MGTEEALSQLPVSREFALLLQLPMRPVRFVAVLLFVTMPVEEVVHYLPRPHTAFLVNLPEDNTAILGAPKSIVNPTFT